MSRLFLLIACIVLSGCLSDDIEPVQPTRSRLIVETKGYIPNNGLVVIPHVRKEGELYITTFTIVNVDSGEYGLSKKTPQD